MHEIFNLWFSSVKTRFVRGDDRNDVAVVLQYFNVLLGGEARFSRAKPWVRDTIVLKYRNIEKKFLRSTHARRRLRFKTNSPGMRLLVEQLKEFPIGDHDDGPDALEMAVRLAAEMLGGVPNDGLEDRMPL